MTVFKFILKTIAVGVVGIIVGIAGTFIGAFIMKDQIAGFGDLAGAIIGMVVGYPLGVIVGIVLMNKVLHYPGSIAFGITGSVLGAFLTIGLAEPLNLNVNPDILFGVFFVSVPLLGMIGFHIKRKTR